MSAYQDIYSDLPSRVHALWKRAQAPADSGEQDLSVTAMLMAAATGLAMPWESLKDVGRGNGSDWNSHPSFVNGDQKHYQAVLKSCNALLSKKIPELQGLENIKLRLCKSQAEIRDAAEDGQLGTRLELHAHTVRDVVRVLRNALAHNNIVAFGQSRERIDQLGFFSENRTGSGDASTIDGYLVLTITTQALSDFLDAWFSSLLPGKP